MRPAHAARPGEHAVAALTPHAGRVGEQTAIPTPLAQRQPPGSASIAPMSASYSPHSLYPKMGFTSSLVRDPQPRFDRFPSGLSSGLGWGAPPPPMGSSSASGQPRVAWTRSPPGLLLPSKPALTSYLPAKSRSVAEPARTPHPDLSHCHARGAVPPAASLARGAGGSKSLPPCSPNGGKSHRGWKAADGLLAKVRGGQSGSGEVTADGDGLIYELIGANLGLALHRACAQCPPAPSGLITLLRDRMGSALASVGNFLEMTTAYILSKTWHDLLSTYVFGLHPMPFCGGTVNGPGCSLPASATLQFL